MSVHQEETVSNGGRFVRFRDRLRRNPLLNTAWKTSVFLVGFLVLLAGLIMMVAPGPGILGIVAGLAILATEFAWARGALDRAKDWAAAAKAKALARRDRRRASLLEVRTTPRTR
ncbi:MAG: PGPGW domain-containing protein [Streptosporangiaceae bacterium]